MSWESLHSREFGNFNSIYHRSGPGVSHQLSATRLLASPEGSRHPLESSSHSWPWNGSYSSLHRNTYTEVRTLKSSNCTFGCFQLCRAKVANSIAKRKVEQGMKLYKQHKQQQAVRKWKTSLKALETREDKFSVLGYLYLAYMDWGKYSLSCVVMIGQPTRPFFGRFFEVQGVVLGDALQASPSECAYRVIQNWRHSSGGVVWARADPEGGS
ncbi:hypothetical protein HUJ04_001063 [Dendroctonus ponderosae]|nr:hypothetical protein HUJ04_001063 [Dendroctonus ponderosae]